MTVELRSLAGTYVLVRCDVFDVVVVTYLAISIIRKSDGVAQTVQKGGG